MNDTKLVNDDTRRLFDVTMPIQIAELTQELKDFKEELHRKLDNGITNNLNRIIDKVMSLQCNVHLEKFNGMNDKFISHDRQIKGLYAAFIGVVVVGILLELWMRH
jgi:hypothetical protein